MKHVIFFYESHSDISATNTILSCKEWLKKFGITGVAVEKPADKEPLLNKESIGLYSTRIKELTTVLQDFHNPTYSKWIDKMCEASGISVDLGVCAENNKMSIIKLVLIQLRTEFESNLKLQMVKDSLDCELFSMDLLNSKKISSWNEAEILENRDKAMCKNIQKHSGPVDSKILVLVGANHNKVAELLKQTGEYIINEIYFDSKDNLGDSVVKIETESVKNLRERIVKEQGTDIYIKTSKNGADADKYAEKIYQKVAPNLYMQEVIGECFQSDQDIIQLINEYNYKKDCDLVGIIENHSEDNNISYCIIL